MKIKLIEQGFGTYTGLLGNIEFDNGVSVHELGKYDIERIASSMRCETVDGSAPVGVAQELLDRHYEEAPIVEPMQTQEEIDAEAVVAAEAAEAAAAIVAAELAAAAAAGDATAIAAIVSAAAAIVAAEAVVAAEAAVANKAVYTLESLTAIADASGIQGVREVADTFGVKGNAIAKLIEDVLAAQAAKAE